jgi:hypothetical protein
MCACNADLLIKGLERHGWLQEVASKAKESNICINQLLKARYA